MIARILVSFSFSRAAHGVAITRSVSGNRHLGSCHSRAVIKNEHLREVFVWPYLFICLGKILRGTIAGSYVNLCFTFSFF